jgi:S-adenosylmethionine hydrolase
LKELNKKRNMAKDLMKLKVVLLLLQGSFMSRIITLTTDFGLTDEYVGVIKGVILTRTPEAIIVDLSHGIERQNIRQAALLVKSAYKFFPERTVHLVVVDPGVGSYRKLILLQADEHFFLAPDNGVLGLLLEAEHFQAAYEVQCEQYYLTPVTTTFHGRDILAPVAAQIAAGLAPEAVGPGIAPRALIKIESQAAKIDRDLRTITGEIISIDHFGNLQTNITGNSLKNLYGDQISTVKIKVKDQIIIGILSAYIERASGELLAIVNSKGNLEVAVNRGNAAIFLGSGIGEKVTVAG